MTDQEVLRFFSHIEDGLGHLTRLVLGEKPALCWVWNAALEDDGYGTFSVEVYGGVRTAPGKDGKRRTRSGRAHRVAFEHFRGPVPAGLYLDHIVCDRRGCVNPWHTEPATPRQNVIRIGRHGGSAAAVNAIKTHCPKGHEYTEENTYLDAGARKCKVCVRARNRDAQLAAPARGPRADGIYCQTHCKRGHEFNEANTYWYRGGRICRACQRMRKDKREELSRRAGSGSITAHNLVKTHCPKSHPYDEGNTYFDARGARHCRTCRDASGRKWAVEHADRNEATPLMLERYPTCKHGHEWTEENTYWYAGQRNCRMCKRDQMRLRRAAAKEPAPSS